MISRRILEPVLLGSIVNFVVNFIFNPTSYEFSIDELIIACILAVPITEANKYLDYQLDSKISWVKHPQKRFGIHLVMISLFLIFSLNVFGNGYMWFTSKGYFSWDELLIINFVTLCVGFGLTLTNWSVYFYNRWKNAEANTSEALRMADELRKKITQESDQIELQKGSSIVRIDAKAVQVAKIEFGTVRVYTTGESGVYPGTLSQLCSQLPAHLHFQVTRDTILHRDTIKSVSSSTYGKIELTINDRNDGTSTYTVSRPKAASFRRWYNSISV